MFGKTITIVIQTNNNRRLIPLILQVEINALKNKKKGDDDIVTFDEDGLLWLY